MRALLIVLIFTCPTFSNSEIAVLILARGGSKGVRLKNLQTLGASTLLQRAIITANLAGFKDITVSTDHPLIALEAVKSGSKVFRRSPITATDWAPSVWGVSEFLAFRSQVTILVLIQVTSPFIKAKHLTEALRKLDYPVPFDCIFSVTRSFKLRWENSNGIARPINFNIKARPRRQDWNGELLETGAFYVTRRNLIEQGFLQNYNCTVLEVPSKASFEVDTNFDLQVAESLLILDDLGTHLPESLAMSNSDSISFESLEATDVISVELVPERKGLILKHCEYFVSSRRHGTTVTRRYNEFVQLHDVLFAKYPYRAVCRLPPKRVVVGGGSPKFLQRRRSALQRWLTLVARHPVLAHDADLRMFLCEVTARLDKPKHDEFVLAGTQEENPRGRPTEEMQATFVSEQEQLRLLQLGLGRLYQVFERVETRCEAERSDIRELGAALTALSTPATADTLRWTSVRIALQKGADLATEMGESTFEELDFTEEGPGGRLLLALDALSAYRELCNRLTRGLHAERAAAAAAAPHSAQSQVLRERHRYALKCSLEEARVARAYALSALESVPELFRTQGRAHGRVASLWHDLHDKLTHT